jgi:uncharacterized protein
VYFSKAGAEKLGHYVEHDLRRLLSSHGMPVALPGPEEQSPAKDAVGPVLPLNAIGTEKSRELLGAAKQPAEREADPRATRVLNRGEAVVAPHGRADDFSWPRSNTSGDADMEPADEVRTKGSVGTSEADEGRKSKPIKSSESKNRAPQSTPAPNPAVRPTAPSRYVRACGPKKKVAAFLDHSALDRLRDFWHD